MIQKKNILVAPVNWGLGHATRCIPIIHELIAHNFNPILASDGIALEMLRKEFPDLQTLELPSYQIKYPKNGNYFKLKMLQNSPKMIAAIIKEKKIVEEWVSEYNLSGIISDNRFGVRSKKSPSIYITHQLNVFSGNTTWLSSKIHQNIIKKFNECWIPDFENKQNLSGKLGHLEHSKLHLKYINPISRFKTIDLPKKYDLLVLLSGPEPQRTILEEKLKTEVKKFNGNVIFIRGIIEKEQKNSKSKNITFYNFMKSSELEIAYNESEIVLCRSGYTTIMDLAKLGKKAFFIPTPGQFEQEYLAKKLEQNKLFPFANQNDFKIENLSALENYTGIKFKESSTDFRKLFNIFNDFNN